MTNNLQSATYRPVTLYPQLPAIYPYPYMHRLEGLRACIPNVASQLPQELKAVTTPLDLSKWQSELQSHPPIHMLNSSHEAFSMVSG